MSAPKRAVYVIAEQEGKKARWTRIGVAFENQDGSLNLLLDAVPTNGKLHVRDFPEEGSEGQEQ